MKRKLLTLILVAIVIVVVAVASLVFLQTTRQQLAAQYNGTLTHTHGYSGAALTAYFHSDRTLFNCQATISYTSSNGTAVQIVKQLGTVDVNAQNFGFGFSLNDYPIPASNPSSTLQFNNTAPLSGLTVKAVGYTSP